MKHSYLTEQEKKFIRDNHRDTTPKDIAEILGASVRKIHYHMKSKKMTIHKDKKQSVNYLKEPGE